MGRVALAHSIEMRIPTATAAALLVRTLLVATLPAQKPTSQPGQKKPFARYTEAIHGTAAKFDLVPIKVGEFVLGSPATEMELGEDEGAQRRVKIAAFWIDKCEVTWGEYELWQLDLDLQRPKVSKRRSHPNDKAADAVTWPTKPYADMSFGMRQQGFRRSA